MKLTSDEERRVNSAVEDLVKVAAELNDHRKLMQAESWERVGKVKTEDSGTIDKRARFMPAGERRELASKSASDNHIMAAVYKRAAEKLRAQVQKKT